MIVYNVAEQNLLDALIVFWLVLALATGFVLVFVSAPYGRHARKGWGPSLDNRLGWMLMA